MIKMLSLILIVIFALFFKQIHAQTSIEEVSFAKNITLYVSHSLDRGRSFSPRTTAKLVPRPDGRYGLLFEDKNIIAGESISVLRALIDANGLYMIIIRTDGSDEHVRSSLPVCELQRSGFKEDIQVFLSKDGSLSGLSYSSPQMTIPHPCDANRIKDTVAFQTRIKLGEDTPAPVLPLQLQAPRPLYFKEVRLGVEEKKAEQAQQPFLYKYWYVVLGLVIYLVLGGGAGPEAPKGQAPAGKSKAE